MDPKIINKLELFENNRPLYTNDEDKKQKILTWLKEMKDIKKQEHISRMVVKKVEEVYQQWMSEFDENENNE